MRFSQFSTEIMSMSMCNVRLNTFNSENRRPFVHMPSSWNPKTKSSKHVQASVDVSENVAFVARLQFSAHFESPNNV